MPVEQPSKFGRFKVERVLGQGAMGTVYLAEDPLIGRQVAIKAITATGDLPEAELRNLQARFEREFCSAGAMSHPNIVTVYDAGQDGAISFIAMEYIGGETLDARLGRSPQMPPEAVREIARGLCSALDYAHANGVIHRDVKPSNILFDSQDQAKITDFGIARIATSTITRTGSKVGTPAYMSPEQVTGHPVTPASDQFSLAIILYLLLTGERPFTGKNATTVMYSIVHTTQVPPSRLEPTLPQALDPVLAKALAKKPEDRFESCAAFFDALDEALSLQPPVATARQPTAADDVATVVLDSAPTRVGEPGQRPAVGEDLAATVLLDELPVEKETESLVSTTVALLASNQRSRLILGAALILLILVSALWFGFGNADSDGQSEDLGRASGNGPASSLPAAGVPAAQTVPPSAATAADARPAEREWTLAVGSDPPRIEIWVNGHPSGDRTPATVRISGAEGTVALVSLRSDGAILQETEVTLGPEMPAQWHWSQPAPAARSLRITSQPAGARVWLDRVLIDDPTPVQIEIQAGQRYSLRLELEGYEAAGWVFGIDDLSSVQLESGLLHFPLAALPTPEPAAVEPEPEPPPAEPKPEAEPTRPPEEPEFRPEPQIPEGPLRAGVDVPEPSLILRLEPDYPSGLRQRVQGTVRMEVLIGRDGSVVSVKIVEGLLDELDRAAEDAVYKWRYRPTLLDGVAVEVLAEAVVRF